MSRWWWSSFIHLCKSVELMFGYIDLSFYCKYNQYICDQGLSEPKRRPKRGTDHYIMYNSDCTWRVELPPQSTLHSAVSLYSRRRRQQQQQQQQLLLLLLQLQQLQQLLQLLQLLQLQQLQLQQLLQLTAGAAAAASAAAADTIILFANFGCQPAKISRIADFARQKSKETGLGVVIVAAGSVEIDKWPEYYIYVCITI